MSAEVSGASDVPVILLVDDDPDIRNVVGIALRRAGFSSREASSGEEALDVVRRESVVAVVLDHELPGMSGIDVIRALRQRPESATLPIVLMTGAGDDHTVVLALENGADDFLTKPVRLDELIARLRAHLRSSSAWADQVTSELRARADVVEALASLPISTEPYDAAAVLVSEIGGRAEYDFVGVLQVADGGHLNVLATYTQQLGVERGVKLQVDRARYLLSRLRDGPWVEIVASQAAYEPVNAFWSSSVDLAAGAPIYAGTVVVGLLTIGYNSGEAGGSPARRARLLASVIDYANILSAAAGLSIAHHSRLNATRGRVRRIIATRAFYPVFQPIVELANLHVFGFEALTRFTEGVAPDVQFAEASEYGFGPDLEAATLESALMAAGALSASATLTLNASPTLVIERARLQSLLDRATMPVVLELTEHAQIEDYAAVREAIASFGPGVRLAVDDAGAGYASLRHILELRPAFVKLDISIVRGIEADPVRQALVSGLVYFAGTTGFAMIGEGIETQAEAGVLRDLGVTFGQGFLFGRPAPIG